MDTVAVAACFYLSVIKRQYHFVHIEGFILVTAGGFAAY